MCLFMKVMCVAWSNTGNLDQLFVQKSNYYILEKVKVILRPNLARFEASEGFMINCKMKADTKLTVVIWCQKFD